MTESKDDMSLLDLLRTPVSEIEKAEIAEVIAAAMTHPDGSKNMTALAIRRLMFQHGELQQQLAAVTRERDDAVAAYRVLEAEGNRCIDEYISGKLTQLRVWSDRMATAIAKSRNSLPAPTDRSGA